MKNTPVTEAHRTLSIAVWAAVKWDETPCGAQLIAASEAKAVEAYAASTRELLQSYMTERDQLRAELATCKDASEALVESLRAELEKLNGGAK